MKYIKLFEKYTEIIEKLENFCKENLVLLLDDGYAIHVRKHPGGYYIIWLNKLGEFFKWDDIKDDFIPFVEMLNEYYYISDISLGKGYEFIFSNQKHGGTDYFKYEDVINDIIPLNKATVSDINKGINEPNDIDLNLITTIGIIVEIN